MTGIDRGARSAGTYAYAPDIAYAPDAHTGSTCTPESGCITCGDVAVPLRVLLVDADRGLALCRDADDRRESVEIALVGAVEPGDELLVHAGTAIAHLGRSAASTAGRGHESEVTVR